MLNLGVTLCLRHLTLFDLLLCWGPAVTAWTSLEVQLASLKEA